jgi:hypothetical protein
VGNSQDRQSPEVGSTDRSPTSSSMKGGAVMPWEIRKTDNRQK